MCGWQARRTSVPLIRACSVNCLPTVNPWQSTGFNRIEEIRKLGQDGRGDTRRVRETHHFRGCPTSPTRGEGEAPAEPRKKRCAKRTASHKPEAQARDPAAKQSPISLLVPRLPLGNSLSRGSSLARGPAPASIQNPKSKI